jgi:hypothetical protein
MVYFSDIFNLDESILEEYGAMNISLLNDIPLFIDPFLLYASEKAEYNKLHESIIDYLCFLKEKASGNVSEEKIKRWYTFPEVKQNWLGYSENGNGGLGLGNNFGHSMSKAISWVFPNIRGEKVTDTIHLEKISLFRTGVGKDNISDFTCNLIKKYLLEYTQTFAQRYLTDKQCRNVAVSKTYFDYNFEVWRSSNYMLPYFNNDYIILTPKDILTKDETWINANEMRTRLLDITNSLPNDELRDQINDVYARQLINKKGTQKELNEAAANTIVQFPVLMDYYIKIKEDERDDAKANSSNIVSTADEIYVKNVQTLINNLGYNTSFYDEAPTGSYESSKKRVLFLKDFIENKDGYKLFYHNGCPIKKEKDLRCEEEFYDKEALEFRFLMMCFRLRAGVNMREYSRRFGWNFEERYGEEIKPFLASKHMVKTQYGYRLTRQGMMVSNYVLGTILTPPGMDDKDSEN